MGGGWIGARGRSGAILPPAGEEAASTDRPVWEAKGRSGHVGRRPFEVPQPTRASNLCRRLSCDLSLCARRDLSGRARCNRGPPQAAPSASGVHPLSQRRRGRGPGWKDHPRHRRQLRGPQASRRAAMAGASSAMDLPLHADLGVVAQRRRRVLRRPNQTSAQTRRLPLRRRPPGRHQPLPRRPQRQFKALPMGRRPRQNHRRSQTRASSVKFDPLVVQTKCLAPIR